MTMGSLGRFLGGVWIQDPVGEHCLVHEGSGETESTTVGTHPRLYILLSPLLLSLDKIGFDSLLPLPHSTGTPSVTKPVPPVTGSNQSVSELKITWITKEFQGAVYTFTLYQRKSTTLMIIIICGTEDSLY